PFVILTSSAPELIQSQASVIETCPPLPPLPPLPYRLPINLVPRHDQFGPAVIAVRITNNVANGATATAEFVLTVDPVNDPPTVDPVPDITIYEDSGPQQ